MSDAELPVRVLVIDDNKIARKILQNMLEADGHEVVMAEGGREGLEALKRGGRQFEVVLCDWMMPDVDGIEVLETAKADPSLAMTPIIMQTSRSDPADIRRGIAAGAYYYVVKGSDPGIIGAMVRTAAEDFGRYAEVRRGLLRGLRSASGLTSGSFRFRSDAEAAGLATLLSYAFPDPNRVATGLSELLLNAVEHGNLGITYAEKSALLEAGSWQQEVDRRLELPEHRDKEVAVEYRHSAGEVVVSITDEGPGFDWEQYLTISPERVFDRHGRGIAMARMLSFDRLEYEAPGNRVTVACAVDRPSG